MISFEKEKVIPVINFNSTENVDYTLLSVQAGGINIAELTLREEKSLEVVKYALEKFPNMTIGVGTVLTLKQAREVIDYGAKFIVSPVLVPEIAMYCIEHDIAYVPGCVTPTEVYNAMSYGLNVVKFFPSEVYGGVNAVKAIAQVFKNVKFMPTGGIKLDNLEQYLSCKSVISCGGTWLATSKMIEDHDFESIRNACFLARVIANRQK